MADATLLPCPFCDATLREDGNCWHHEMADCPLSDSVFDEDQIAEWNTRQPPSQVPADHPDNTQDFFARCRREAEAKRAGVPSDDGLIKALEKCRDKFREYARQHDAKAIAVRGKNLVEYEERHRKAVDNRQMAEMCEAALSRHKAAGDDVEQRAVQLRINEMGRWWHSLSDTHRAALLAGRLSMKEQAFEAGARAALTALQVTEGDKLLNWLGENVGMELRWGEIDGDLSECAWQVHRRQGGTNDREWNLVATGKTPLAALQSAHAALHSKQEGEGR